MPKYDYAELLWRYGMGRKADKQAAEVMKSLGLDPKKKADREAYNGALKDLVSDGKLIEDPDGTNYIVGS
jgi:hypothetical protein